MLKRLAAPAVAAVVTAAAVFTFGPGPTTPVPPPPQTPVTLAQPPAVDAGLVSEPGLAPRPLAAHESQRRINGPWLFVAVSAGMFQSDNPRGWSWEWGRLIETRGWDIVWEKAIEPRLGDGFEGVWLWEPTGQWLGIGSCMAWISEKTLRTGWSPKMFETWPEFKAKCAKHGLSLALYSGCAVSPNVGDSIVGATRHPPFSQSDVSLWVEGCTTVRRLGVEIIGLDAFSWLIHLDPAFARAVIEAIRADPYTKNMTLVTEGWLPTKAANGSTISPVDRQFFLQHLVCMELARGGNGVDPMQDRNWGNIRTIDELALVPGRRGLILLHGSNFTRPQVDHVRRHTADLGLYWLGAESPN